MPARVDHPRHVWLFLAVLASGGALLCGFGGPQLFPEWTVPADSCPLPHHVPKFPGVASLRFAMVHDVLTERYAKHGPAWYEERNRRTRLLLAKESSKKETSRKHLELIDDLAAGLDLLGQHAESVSMMREKLDLQRQLGHTGMDLYSTYANLGTFLILWEIHDGLADKKKAKAGLEEGTRLIHEAIAINPRSHFGREIWQAVVLEYLLAALDNPEVLVKFDMAGNRLDEAAPFPGGKSWQARGWSGRCGDAFAYLQIPEKEQDPARLQEFRQFITTLTPGAEWGVLNTSHKGPVPFDEPTLGIIGMWRLGGGPNPIFAMALGEIMLRVGQGYIAWNAYERAFMLAGGIPEEVRQKFKDHCRARQRSIEASLPQAETPRLRFAFGANLQQGLQYQQEYQAYEARRIRDGASIDDPQFFADFEKAHGPIASPVGDEDRFVPRDAASPTFSLPMMLLGAGTFAFAGALVVCWRNRRGRETATS